MSDLLPEEVLRLLDSSMEANLFERVELDSSTYYFVDQFDDIGGEPVIVRQASGSDPEIVDDIAPSDEDTGGSEGLSPQLRERLEAIRGFSPDFVGDLGGAGVLSQSGVSTKFREQAERCSDVNDPQHLKSANAAGTNGGRLACAWAVNRVAKLSLGSQIGGGLATASMVVVLRDHHNQLDGLVSGSVIISPTITRPDGSRNIGHVGIVGQVNTSNQDQTPIYSNSSSRARFEKNFTFANWIQRYKDSKGLKVLLFQLEPSRFPSAGA